MLESKTALDNSLNQSYKSIFDEAIKILDPTSTEEKANSFNRFACIIERLNELREASVEAPESVDSMQIAHRARSLAEHLRYENKAWAETMLVISSFSNGCLQTSEKIKNCLKNVSGYAAFLLPFLQKPSDPTKDCHLAWVKLSLYRENISRAILEDQKSQRPSQYSMDLTNKIDEMIKALSTYTQGLAESVFRDQISHAEARRISAKAYSLATSLCENNPQPNKIVAAIKGLQRAASRINNEKIIAFLLVGSVVGAAIGMLLIFCPPLAILAILATAAKPLLATAAVLACATVGALLVGQGVSVADKYCGVSFFRKPLLENRTAEVASSAMELNRIMVTPKVK